MGAHRKSVYIIIGLCTSLSLQTLCFASGANETAHVAKVVARQRSSKKTGRPHLVNTHMRVKPAAPLVLNGEILAHCFGSTGDDKEVLFSASCILILLWRLNNVWLNLVLCYYGKYFPTGTGASI